LNPSSQIPKLVDHLFRHEAGKIVPVLARLFGPSNLDLAEDVVQDALIEAMVHWEYEGVPDNPAGWLHRVARNKAINVLNREAYQRQYRAQALRLNRMEQLEGPDWQDLFSEPEIQDGQLRMIFACCHPSISPDSQIALALKTLCGFSIPEIAKAFLTTEDNISKRLKRARQSIRDADAPFSIPQGKELGGRLDAVLATRDKETIHALLALMLINASRFKARQDVDGNLVTLEKQDRELWDSQLLSIGLGHLTESTRNDRISVYHIHAAISAQYSIAADYESIDWQTILSFYESLVELDHSPVVLLNRAIVVSKVSGVRQALDELEKIADEPAFQTYYLFYSTMGELQMQAGDPANAILSLEKAIDLAPLVPEKELLSRKLKQIK
jgi:RNA polymerase sigma-70 factor (ECF subfamily)